MNKLLQIRHSGDCLYLLEISNDWTKGHTCCDLFGHFGWKNSLCNLDFTRIETDPKDSNSKLCDSLPFAGAFFVPYVIFFVCCGIPVFFLETALGQFTSEGGITCWRKVCPLFEGQSRVESQMALFSMCSAGIAGSCTCLVNNMSNKWPAKLITCLINDHLRI